MSAWRRIAIEKLPSMQHEIATSENPYALWITIWHELTYVYRHEPLDDAFIAAVYEYGRWCMQESRNGDIATAAAVCFYEDIPLERKVWADAGRWLSIEEFEGLKGIFSYRLGSDEISVFTYEFMEQKKALETSARYKRRKH